MPNGANRTTRRSCPAPAGDLPGRAAAAMLPTMQFAETPNLDHAPRHDRRWWRPVLYLSAGAAALATRWPWTEVRFTRIWEHVFGPPGWQSSAGFTCLCASLMATVMTLIETSSQKSREAVRPGTLLLVAIALLALLAELFAGPGMLRGVTAAWTTPFYVACVALPLLTLVCGARCIVRGSRHR